MNFRLQNTKHEFALLAVQKLLRHKRLENTMKYIHMVNSKDDEFDVAIATNVEEAKQILAACSTK